MGNFEDTIRHILIYYFKKGKGANEAREELRSSRQKCNKKMFAHRSSSLLRLTTIKSRHWCNHKHTTIQELGIALKMPIGSVNGHLKSLGFVKKLDV